MIVPPVVNVVAELDGPENEALDLVPLITNTVLEENHLVD